ncbi:hypothetical protein HY463_01825 [Candidatus Peregrinibacteria bacterium]|nr:hypothetical protein [Candidatus Peregrinibacteria bacterium]
MNIIQNLFRRDDRFSAFSMGAVLVLLAAFMGIFSLTSLNEKATKGYLVNKLESEKQDLVRDGEITDMLNLRARSLETIQTSNVVARMVKADEIVYVTPITVVAQK